MAKSKSNPESLAEALGQLADESSVGSASVPELVAAAKAPTTAEGAAVHHTSKSAKPQPPQTVAEAHARSQRGLKLLTNVIKALERASDTITLSGKHTRSAIDNTFKLAHANLLTATENFKRSADSVASTNNRMARTLKTLTTLIQNLPNVAAGGLDPGDLTEIKEQLSAIREALANPKETPGTQGFQTVTESLRQLKETVEGTLIVANDQAAHATGQAALELKELARIIEARTGKLTTLVLLSLVCSIFAALCAFGGILTMLLKMVK